MPKPTRVDYCQYLLSTPLNYTLTHFGDHSESFSHDQINRYLAKDRLTPEAGLGARCLRYHPNLRGIHHF